MKETKVYVDELPVSCVDCKHFAENRRQCNLGLCLQWSEEKFKFNDCPLINIKIHDQELVKEVCDSIRGVCRLNFRTYKKHLPEDCEKYKEVNAFNKAILGVLEFIDEIQKEYEK